VTDEFTLPVDVDVLAIYPHAHYLGKDLRAIAKFPDGRSETLIHIPDWNLNWQAVYRYAQPFRFAEGHRDLDEFRLRQFRGQHPQSQ